MVEPKTLEEAKQMLEEQRQKLIQQVTGSERIRALVYSEFLPLMKKEMGVKKAKEVFYQATFNAGRKMQKMFFPEKQSLPDFRETLLKALPAEGAVNGIEFVKCSEEELVIKVKSCPFKEFWRQLGLSKEEVLEMCEVADGIDHGDFGAMYNCTVDFWDKHPEDCCIITLKPKTE